MKHCYTCRNDKPTSEFNRQRAAYDGLQSECRICQKYRNRNYYSENPWVWYEKSYGITLERYNQMLNDQDGVCAICSQPESRLNLFIDHDHETGEVRGLLCNHCNRGLGGFRDRVDLLCQAMGYLLGSKGVFYYSPLQEIEP